MISIGRILSAGTLALVLGAAAEPEPAPLPGWMAGAWISQQPDGSWSEEWWTPPKAGLMMGAGRSGKGDATEWWEHTRIEQSDGKIRFCALPKGQAGACFPATRTTASEIVFENSGHDYPTRVAYRLDGKELLAEISGPNGSKPQNWRFRRPD